MKPFHGFEDSQQLLAAAREGDQSALGQLTGEMRPYVKAVIAKTLGGRLVGKVDDSDVAQEVLKAAVENFASFQGESLGEWYGWLMAIAQNESRNVIRYWHQRRRDADRELALQFSAEQIPPGEKSSPSEVAVRRERAARLFAAIERLGEDDQQIVRWRHFDGLSHAEIAQKLGINEAAARQRWRAALQRLKQIVGKTE